MNIALLQQLRPGLFDDQGHATERLRRILALDYRLEDRPYPLPDVVRMTRAWVSATKKNAEGQPAQRWEVTLPAHIEALVRDFYLPLFARAGYVDETSVCHGVELYGISEVDDLVVPGGRARPQGIRLAKLARQWELGARFSNLLFQIGSRVLTNEELDLQWIRDLRERGTTAPGWLPIRTDVEIADLRPGSQEVHLMALLWRIVELPEALAKVVPNYIANIPAWFADRGARSVQVVSIQPHRFHDLMYRRLVPPGSSLRVVFAGADTARNDAAYLMDGLGHDMWELSKAVA